MNRLAMVHGVLEMHLKALERSRDAPAESPIVLERGLDGLGKLGMFWKEVRMLERSIRVSNRSMLIAWRSIRMAWKDVGMPWQSVLRIVQSHDMSANSRCRSGISLRSKDSLREWI